ncbi:MAG: TolC family protein [Methylococcales bacterium]|nr:TolC family protein [Methylococcales bacterium]
MNFQSHFFYPNKSIALFIGLILYLLLQYAVANTSVTSNLPHLNADEPRGVLVLSQALSLALLQNPNLDVFSKEIRIQEALQLQAGLRPNPTFNASASNFGNSAYEGFDGEAVSLELSQLIELGGKRAARIKAAGITQELANWDYETKRMDVLTQVAQAFIQVLAAQESLILAKKMQEVADKMTATVSALFEAGNVASVEKIKAQVMQSTTGIKLMRAEKKLAMARNTLAATWGSYQPHFESVIGDLNTIKKLPTLSYLWEQLRLNPDLARWTDEISQRHALMELEQSKAIPDVTVTLGINNNLIPNEYAMLAGISIPLPLFDRNQGNISAARYRVSQAEDEQRSRQLNIKTALNTTYQQLQIAYQEIETLDEVVIPSANSAYKIAQKGYQLGKFNLLNLLDAQRTLFSVQTQYLRALTDYHLNVAQIERLTGSALTPLAEKTEQ